MRVWYLVSDFDSGRSFYKRALGFEETYVDFDDKWAQLERGQTQIALAVGDPNPEGPVATIDVDDVKAEADRLRASSVTVGTVLELAGQMRLVDVFVPDGNRIQLTQPLE
ncbi:MAG: VOC family protein [Actinobacteria bacterium]|nr:VOC family protein [Actinomycetota bacterium]